MLKIFDVHLDVMIIYINNKKIIYVFGVVKVSTGCGTNKIQPSATALVCKLNINARNNVPTALAA